MEPILSKSEIADLLKAIREGRVSLDLDDQRKEDFLEHVWMHAMYAARMLSCRNIFQYITHQLGERCNCEEVVT